MVGVGWDVGGWWLQNEIFGRVLMKRLMDIDEQDAGSWKGISVGVE